MRNTIKWLALAALAIPAAGCVESADQAYGYSDGYYSPSYSGGYYPSSGYYATPSVSNYYYTPAPTVVTQTRYVPVPTPVPVPSRQADRSNDHHWNGNNNQPQQPPQHVDRPHTPPPQANNNPQANTNSGRNGNSHDRNGDGQPDRRS
jgi:hypothetical protein